uniref:Uncharacterized protein n=1 Tax=Chromera velia CCMP2878 TaxID=1169474 RepID=A0A0G4H007_9ALVE|eukprot:Cvel_24061.t1-p1 / transcript=Cvel_24061.t1 / gene=Cvel_24061 / organism=Chromera_velia_CCMP2878 / gene_product=hypothetical protein / transcript_product=hypothetical protein / location=Cvel_scaffold2560:749-10047(-) / protein_length=751 / sequence_SO=supercontig / SO=protein_coding / is_pseudo=false
MFGRAAAVYSLFELARLLIYSKRFPLDEEDAFGNSPAFRAAGWGQNKMVLWLEAQGADLGRKNRFGDSLLHNCAQAGNSTLAAALMKAGRCDPLCANINGIVPLLDMIESMPNQAAALFDERVHRGQRGIGGVRVEFRSGFLDLGRGGSGEFKCLTPLEKIAQTGRLSLVDHELFWEYDSGAGSAVRFACEFALLIFFLGGLPFDHYFKATSSPIQTRPRAKNPVVGGLMTGLGVASPHPYRPRSISIRNYWRQSATWTDFLSAGIFSFGAILNVCRAAGTSPAFGTSNADDGVLRALLGSVCFFWIWRGVSLLESTQSSGRVAVILKDAAKTVGVWACLAAVVWLGAAAVLFCALAGEEVGRLMRGLESFSDSLVTVITAASLWSASPLFSVVWRETNAVSGVLITLFLLGGPVLLCGVLFSMSVRQLLEAYRDSRRTAGPRAMMKRLLFLLSADARMEPLDAKEKMIGVAALTSEETLVAARVSGEEEKMLKRREQTEKEAEGSSEGDPVPSGRAVAYSFALPQQQQQQQERERQMQRGEGSRSPRLVGGRTFVSQAEHAAPPPEGYFEIASSGGSKGVEGAKREAPHGSQQQPRKTAEFGKLPAAPIDRDEGKEVIEEEGAERREQNAYSQAPSRPSQIQTGEPLPAVLAHRPTVTTLDSRTVTLYGPRPTGAFGGLALAPGASALVLGGDEPSGADEKRSEEGETAQRGGQMQESAEPSLDEIDVRDLSIVETEDVEEHDEVGSRAS